MGPSPRAQGQVTAQPCSASWVTSAPPCGMVQYDMPVLLAAPALSNCKTLIVIIHPGCKSGPEVMTIYQKMQER